MSDSQPAAPAAPVAPVGEDVALAIRGLVKIYGNLVAVADLSFRGGLSAVARLSGAADEGVLLTVNAERSVYHSAG